MNNPQLFLTDFVEVVHKSGGPKFTKLKDVKNRPDYEPAFDFYRPIRQAIADTHARGGSRAEFQAVAGTVQDPKKQKNYPPVIAGYLKWWGNKSFKWIAPPREHYSSSGVDVVINPELGLTWAANTHFIKLYFKDVPLSKLRVDLILDLMEVSLRKKLPTGSTVSILDIRASRLYPRATGPLTWMPMIDAELAYIASLWPHL